MTDMKSDSGGAAKFNVRASTEFVGATQALVSLTPSKSGSAAFLAVGDTETIPSAMAAEVLLAYRNIDFSGTSAQIIQFALSISATQDATSGEVSGGTGAVLQPSTVYKIVMYSGDSNTTLLRFTTLGNINERYPFSTGNNPFNFDMSAHNFRTGTDGKLQVPFVFSWLSVNSILLVEITTHVKEIFTAIGSFDGSAGRVSTLYNNLANHFGDKDRGGIFLHTPLRSILGGSYQVDLTNSAGNGLGIFYKHE
ncbi:hypothetical protein P0082_08430 [Candidatus Haliotispira prima]|uniref:Uncharacterized protein n=1 Tax=Candidatus Haliotispira prima TaxID=3034016 RepID=A0ABY8MEU2_9SPIO|nr:hypothetical protein P0082_08430 [Candidatus Haliotispira prima]